MFKCFFDFVFSLFLLVLSAPFFLFIWVLTAVDTASSGFFLQKRIGRYGEKFTIYKFRTFHKKKHTVSFFGQFLRNSKLDELPQLINILKGEMSFVGPRPDVEGYYDLLQGEERKVLNLKPGLTSEATIKYRNEEELMAQMPNLEEYNDKVIFPDKVKMNLKYYYNQSFWLDLKIILKTIFNL